jgi:hypothetical protein
MHRKLSCPMSGLCPSQSRSIELVAINLADTGLVFMLYSDPAGGD